MRISLLMAMSSKACASDLQQHPKDLLLNNETSFHLKQKWREKLIQVSEGFTDKEEVHGRFFLLTSIQLFDDWN